MCIRERIDLPLNIILASSRPQFAYVLGGILPPITGQQPTRRLGQKREQDEDQGRHEYLQTDGNLPAGVGGDTLGSIGDQCGNDLAEDDHKLNGGAEHAAENFWSGFGLVDGTDNDGHASHAEENDTSEGKHGDVLCGGLEYNPTVVGKLAITEVEKKGDRYIWELKNIHEGDNAERQNRGSTTPSLSDPATANRALVILVSQ